MKAGFTLIEVAVSVAIIAVMAAVSIVGFSSLQKRADLNNSVQEIVNVLKLAQTKTISYQSSSRYGVYFDTTTSPDSYVLFKGNDYASREVASDVIYFLPDKIEFYNVDFQGGNELVFNRLTGSVNNWGSVSLWIEGSAGGEKAIYVSNLGVIGFEAPSVSNDEARVKDSRHVHVDYGRYINSESLILSSNEILVLQIPIDDNLIGGQFEWQGSVNVGGQDQVLEIHTHWFNDPLNHTRFCIHRDMRFNDAALEVSLSDDPGYLIEYSADGLTTYSSIYVSEPGPEWQ